MKYSENYNGRFHLHEINVIVLIIYKRQREAGNVSDLSENVRV